MEGDLTFQSVLGRVLFPAVAGAIGFEMPASAAEYAYDGQGRLVSVIADDGRQSRYSLDAPGNRLSLATAISADHAPGPADRSFDLPESQQSWSFDPRGAGETIAGFTQGEFGAVSLTNNGTRLTYAPAPGHAGLSDSFAFTLANAAGLTGGAMATVVLINSPPQVINDTRSDLPRNQPFSFDPTENDSDPGGGPVAIVGLGVPNAVDGGSAAFTAHELTFTPTSGFAGSSVFSYTIADTAGAQTTGTVTLVMAAGQGVIEAHDDSGTVVWDRAVILDVVANDVDPEGDPLKAKAIVQAPAKGAATVLADGRVRYDPAVAELDIPAGGSVSDTFRYSVRDSSDSAATEATATVTVAIMRLEEGNQ